MDRLLNAGAAAVVAAVVLACAPAAAAGDAAKGQALFVRCTICHTAQSGAGNRIGPNLFGVVGRKAGTLAGYSYSRAMANSGIVWSEDTLQPYLMGPANVVPGTKMTFAGFSDPKQAGDVAAYLATLK
jgi:cytochrome c